MLIEAQALGINGVLKTNNFEIGSGETANIYEIIFFLFLCNLLVIHRISV